jgi:hypothetical protein
MAFQTSPGVVVREWDVSTYVPGVSTTEAGIGGVFSWGPVEAPELISSEGELALRFGKPTEYNYETFHIAANFLAYSDALYVSRAADANAYNAVAATANVTPVQIKNDTDFIVKQATLPAGAVFYARFPSDLGNSLKVSVCDSANAFRKTYANTSARGVELELVRDEFTAILSVTDAVGSNATVANTLITSILDDLVIGDYINVSSGSLGSQNLQLTTIGAPTANAGVARATLTFNNRFQLAEDVEVNQFARLWEFYDSVDRAPGTSTYTADRGGSGDELHIVVVDEGGKFTGTPGTILEVWQALSRATDVVLEGASKYYKDVLFNSSTYIYAAGDRAGAVSGPASTMAPITTEPLTISLTGGTATSSESGVSLAALARAYDKFKSPEDIDVSILIAGKAHGGVHGEALANYIIDNVIEYRKDCVVTISPALTDVVNNPFQEEDDLSAFRHSLRKSSYAFLTSSYKWQYDKYFDKYRWVAGCGDDAGLMARTDLQRDAWWSPAGHSRGIYKNIIKLGYNPDKSARDFLYKNDINPVVTMKGSGTLLYGDKTLLGSPSAFDRINVRRLFIVLEKAISKAARELLFEFNDEFTRARFRNMVTPFLRDVQGRRGIQDFKVVCDTSNNTGTVIDRNEFIGAIFIKPAKSINYITLDFVAVGTDIDFNYVVGKYGG